MSDLILDGYVDIVNRAKEYIGAGEVFQVVLARKLGVAFDGEYKAVFMRLLETNPCLTCIILRWVRGE